MAEKVTRYGDDRYRVLFTAGSLSGTAIARKRRRCDGHLNPERHFIEPGQRWFEEPDADEVVGDGVA